MRKRVVFPLIAVFVAMVGLAIGSAQIRYEDIQADQTFRDGVQRMQDGLYAEAVFQFQRSLSLRSYGPEAIQTRIMLGRAYYHAGFEDAAMQEWKTVTDQGGASTALVSFQEYLQARKGMAETLKEDYAFFPVAEINNTSIVARMRRPAAVLPLPDGQTLIASFGTDALVYMDANGRLTKTLRGGFTRLSGPFDMVLVNNARLYVTQFLGNQVYEMKTDGTVVKIWGSKGIGPGQFMGPQYIAADDAGYLYVSDYGNGRISKFDPDGNFVLSFGERSEDFDGLRRPMGLAWYQDKLYAIDARRDGGRLLVWDSSGNLLDSQTDDRLSTAEGIDRFRDGQLIISTAKEILTYEPDTQTISDLYTSKDAKNRFIRSAVDANGTMVASDFDGERIELLSRLAGVYAGLHVQINRVVATNFPDIQLDATITDNLGVPVVGLDQANFTLTEGKRPATFKLVYAGHRENDVDGIFVVEASQLSSTDFNKEAATNAVLNAYDAIGSPARLGFVSAGQSPSVDANVGASRDQLKKAVESLPYDLDWAFDKALRLAVPVLARSPGLRNILFVSAGDLPETAFKAYGLQETLSYLRNNRVSLTVLNLRQDGLDPALEMLVRETGGSTWNVYDPKGFAGLGDTLRNRKDGSYGFTYSSKIDSDFGRKYLPVEVEVRLFQKSGRDETGYFAPMQIGGSSSGASSGGH